MTSASEWHRAGIAVSGVTLVLLIAGGIYFIAPAPPDSADPPATLARSSEPADTDTAPVRIPPALEQGAIERQPGTALRPRVVAPRARVQTTRPRTDEYSLPGFDAPRLETPLVATLRIPEDTVRFEPMRLATSERFLEPPLPAVTGDHAADRDTSAAHGTRRDPVTAAFVTAGSAVAGGFRSAGRAMKRVF